MHWSELIFSLLEGLSQLPTRRTPDDKSSRLFDWARWGFFVVHLFLALLVGAAILIRLFGA